MPVTESLFAFLDTETTGLEPGVDDVIEIATVLTDLDLKEISVFEARIQTRKVVSREAQAVNGYDPAVWEKTAVPFTVYQDWLTEHVRYGHVAIPVGHNVGFDREMIDLAYYKPRRKFCPLSYHKVDTVALAGAMRAAGILKSPDLKLVSVAAALGIEHGKAHSAMADCRASMEIFKRAVRMFRAGQAESKPLFN